MHRSPAPRLHPLAYSGAHRYFLTICTHARRPIFTAPAPVDEVHAQLVRTSRSRRVAVIAYCYMPDHLHLLVQGHDPEADVLRWIQFFKQGSGFHWKTHTGEPLWQRRFFDRVLRASEATAVVARYILMNPVRKGLCVHPRDYPYLGSLTHDVGSLIAAAQGAPAEGRK